MIRIAAFAFAALLPMVAQAEDLKEKLSAYMDAATSHDHFSGSVLVAKGGEVVLTRGYGLANAEYGIANTPETKFRLGSITKQFTATGILILAERGKLAVEDPVGKYLDDAPAAWEKVTIHHLLTHTSGIPSYTDDPAFMKVNMVPQTVGSMVAGIKAKPLDFEPGSKYHYNNSGYFLLGAIIEKVSGMTYEAFLGAEIFKPLEMTETGYDHHETVLPNRASGYDRRGSELRNAPHLDMSLPYAAGSLYSTVGDLYKWDRALKAGKLLSGKSFEAMYTPFKDNYAYGWAVTDFKGHKIIGHGGGINGFSTDFARFPDDDLCVIVLCNVNPSKPGEVARNLASIAFGEDVPLPRTRVKAKVDPKIYDDYVGEYRLTPKMTIKVTRDGDRLITQGTGQGKLEIFPESETAYFPEEVDALLTFVKEDGKVTHIMVHQNGKDMKGDRVE
ncbi:serine hydrolase [Isosphaeraceae bacterium EP7]